MEYSKRICSDQYSADHKGELEELASTMIDGFMRAHWVQSIKENLI